MIDSEFFRHVLGHLPTGVAILTSENQGDMTGMSCNSVTSVSLDPPLIAVCPAKASTTWPLIRQAGRFCVSVMASDQEDTIRRFATKGVDRFAGIEVRSSQAGPALEGAMAWLECEIQDEHVAGDHYIVVAEVLRLEANSVRDPLVFFRGRYGTFASGNVGVEYPVHDKSADRGRSAQ